MMIVIYYLDWSDVKALRHAVRRELEGIYSTGQ